MTIFNDGQRARAFRDRYIQVQTLGTATRLICVVNAKALGGGANPAELELVISIVVPTKNVPIIAGRLRGLGIVEAAGIDDERVPLNS